MVDIDKLFIAEIKKQLYLRKLKYEDLAKITGCTKSSITAFMCGARESRATATAIAAALGVKR